MNGKIVFLTVFSLILLFEDTFAAKKGAEPVGLPLFSKDARKLQKKYEAKAKKLMIATQGEHSTRAGIEIFKKGGNIVDVATAITFVISVERPQSTGIGGGGFLLFKNKDRKFPLAYDFREQAPKRAKKNMYLDRDGKEVKGKSITGPHAVAVPGLVAGILTVQGRYGKLPLNVVMQPAIDLAKNGMKVYPELADALKYKKKDLQKFPSSVAVFFREKDKVLDVYKEGEILYQKDLAGTLERIAEQGNRGFYGGRTSKSIVKTIRQYGGIIDPPDFGAYKVKQREPVYGKYKDYEIYSMSPPSSGGIHIVQILNILEQDKVSKWGPGSSNSIHLTASAMQAAFADRAKYLGDTDFVKVPVDGLVSKKYAKNIRKQISLNKARTRKDVSPGEPFKFEKDHTTHFTIADGEGNIIVSTQTINGWFGSSLVAEGTGIVLNNEMDDFATKPGASNLFGAIGGENNLVAPKKRPLSSMSPTIVLKNDKPVLALGTPSGTRILTCVAQTILNYIEYKMPLYDAVASLRYHHQWAPDYIRVENRGFSKKIESELKEKGHKVEKKNLGCRIQAIAFEKGQLIGVSDPRGEGASEGI